MSHEDCLIIKAMKCYGGSFVQALAAAAHCADETNLNRIKATWPECWMQYSAMAKNQIAAAIVETHPMSEYQGED
jgi:hypothetical protein